MCSGTQDGRGETSYEVFWFIWKFCVFWRAKDFCLWNVLCFSKAQCCASTNLLCGYVQTSSLPFLFAFSFFSLCPLSAGKVTWEGGQCWRGKTGACLSWFMTPELPKGETFTSEHPPWVYCPSLRSSKISLPRGTRHCGFLSSRTIKIIFLRLNIGQHFWWRTSRKTPIKLNLWPSVLNCVCQLSDLKTIHPRFIQGPWKGH